jgi:hypothetical protein
MKPAIVYNVDDLKRSFVGKTFKEIRKELDATHKKLKEATGYTWDNQNWYIEDMFGQIQLSLYISKANGTLYDRAGTQHVDSLCHSDTFNETHLEIIKEALYGMANGDKKCNDCGKWTKETRDYGFAGVVCNSCFNPHKHKTANTAGD